MLYGLEEYALTAGCLSAFVGIIYLSIALRKDIRGALAAAGISKKHILLALAVMLVFIVVEISTVKPTQQLFFDDAIYQAGAQSLLHMGQAWMCNYGTPTHCIAGQVYHEPIGTSFLLAIAFLFFGISRSVAFYAFIAMAALSVFLVFLLGALIFKNPYAALFSALILAFSPILLVWAAPTTSDLPSMLFSIFAFFSLMVFLHKKTYSSLLFALLSFAIATYMKVNMFIFLFLLPIFYILLDARGIKGSISYALKLLRKSFLDVRLIASLLVFLLIMLPELLYVVQQNSIPSNYGDTGVIIWMTCSNPATPLNVTSKFSLQNFRANICANLNFWVNAYGTAQYPVMQPFVFTILALIGASFLILHKRKKVLLSLSLWFFSFFIVYTAFYAGSVLYGVDWRFMLVVIPVTALLGGYALSSFIGLVKRFSKKGIFLYAAIAFSISIIAYPTIALYPQLSINPAEIIQAQGARFYENFVYSNISSIPKNCLVFTFDPTLFNINNRAATQFSNLSIIENPAGFNEYMHQYGCLAIDYGYWCASTTPATKQYCDYSLSRFKVKLLSSAYLPTIGATYSIYQILGLNGTR